MNVSPGFDLDSLTTCVVLIDEHGIVDTLNQAAQVLLETSSLRAVGLPFGELASAAGDAAIHWHETLTAVVSTRLPAVRFRHKIAI